MAARLRFTQEDNLRGALQKKRTFEHFAPRMSQPIKPNGRGGRTRTRTLHFRMGFSAAPPRPGQGRSLMTLKANCGALDRERSTEQSAGPGALSKASTGKQPVQAALPRSFTRVEDLISKRWRCNRDMLTFGTRPVARGGPIEEHGGYTCRCFHARTSGRVPEAMEWNGGRSVSSLGLPRRDGRLRLARAAAFTSTMHV